jgi:hypothetical protein
MDEAFDLAITIDDEIDRSVALEEIAKRYALLGQLERVAARTRLTLIRYGRAGRNPTPVESGGALRSRNATSVLNRNPRGWRLSA